MNTYTPEQVKKMVYLDMKSRKLTQQDVAEKIGSTRQTISTVLSSDEYFNDKQATLFSLAFGYDKNFLRTGEGTLISYESEYGMKIKLEYQEKLLDMYKQTTTIANRENDLVLRLGLEKCRPLLTKTRQLYNFLTTFQSFPPLYINGKENPPFDPELINAASRIFHQVFSELAKLLEEE